MSPSFIRIIYLKMDVNASSLLNVTAILLQKRFTRCFKWEHTSLQINSTSPFTLRFTAVLEKRQESAWTPSCGVACQSFRSHSVVSLSMPLMVSQDLEWRDWCNVQSESTGAVSRECRNGELSRNSLTSTWLNCSLGNNAGGELRSEAKWMEMTSDWRPSADWCSCWYHRLVFFVPLYRGGRYIFYN